MNFETENAFLPYFEIEHGKKWLGGVFPFLFIAELAMFKLKKKQSFHLGYNCIIIHEGTI